ncbi:MAG: class I SAM-dependent methyltransferase [Pseudomonadales bacterium]
MNDLEKYFIRNEGRLIHKWAHYFEVYDHHFSKFRNQEVTILEIGVSHGGSLQMWKDYFGEKAKIYGVDINPQCNDFEEENIKIFIGSQSNRQFLRELKEKIPKIDILIDDGGHTMKQQIITFEELFDHIEPSGVYFCEDLHSSYWMKFGGGHKRRGTFIEYTKNFIDYLNAHHSQQGSLRVNSFTQSVHSVHYYDSIIVVEKRKIEQPSERLTGNMSFERKVVEKNTVAVMIARCQNLMIYGINYVLRILRLPGIWWR